MPYYDLRCEKCQHEFTIKASIQARTDGSLRCPDCSSDELATVYKKVNVLKYKGKDCDVCPGAGPSAPRGCCGGGCCGHGHG